ncbi:MAG: methylenetetrahydrofolate reductase C-terminal domain-containing protein [Anaerolineales bacterium]
MKHPRRFRSAFLPISPPQGVAGLALASEKAIKSWMFQCSMCGNCILQATAYICPMLCPKGLRNGPCGSGSEDQCCVNPGRPCVWHLIYRRAEAMENLEGLLEVQAPLDWSRVGHSTWFALFQEARKRKLLTITALKPLRDWKKEVSILFRDMRQPAWWNGDQEHHPATSHEQVSSLQTALMRGEFVVTSEFVPPTGVRLEDSAKKVESLRGRVHAVNVAENPMATAHMSSLAGCQILKSLGLEPILQVTARDYQRLILQSEVLGANALGINNILCLTGDAPTAGRAPFMGLPFDLDATQMLWILRRLRDQGLLLDGRQIDDPPRIFLGAAGSPNDPNPTYDALRLEKKINAGAQFIQTQLVYEGTIVERWLEALDKRDLLSKAHVLIGISPLRSLQHAVFLQERIPDITIPSIIMRRFAESPCPGRLGVDMALELIEEIRALPGVSGVHLMALGETDTTNRLLDGLRAIMESAS